ncbi:hypothetical protein FNJ84_20210 [Paracoccus sp. M683]|uniref:hypothetical protein n=1 Tax=Paracoccus sp. M683 TaxID=2594268 RepID=UPI001180099C|nr:hypothetical protein [Paracoccus sp. M683]TRW93134.1 hypothetical protein FNJ84_20210 [Paracoccus sp. M683]
MVQSILGLKGSLSWLRKKMKNTEIARRHDRILSLLASHASLSAAAMAGQLSVQELMAELHHLTVNSLIN